MKNKTTYSIGTQGKKWGDAEKSQWLSIQNVKRSYLAEVVSKIDALAADFIVEQYGLLEYRNKSYPLYAIKSANWLVDQQNNNQKYIKKKLREIKGYCCYVR